MNEALNEAAQSLASGDAERLRAAMAAPLSWRPKMLALYGFNLEVSRAAWASKEPLLAEMRLQWWRDELERIKAGQGEHPLAPALQPLLSHKTTPLLAQMIEARRQDIYKEPFASQERFDAYLSATGALPLLLRHTQGLEVTQAHERAAQGGALARWFVALPALRALGMPVFIETPDQQAEAARAALQSWQALRPELAFLDGWQTAELLKRAMRGQPPQLSPLKSTLSLIAYRLRAR